jgi:hypothetical protein
MKMKIRQLIEILSSLAAAHPNADVTFAYPSRHAGRPQSKRGNLTGHHTHLMSHPALSDMVVLQIAHARARDIEDDPPSA